MEIDWKVMTVTGELAAERLARLLARLILDAEQDAPKVAPDRGCALPGNIGRNGEIPSTQEVSS